MTQQKEEQRPLVKTTFFIISPPLKISVFLFSGRNREFFVCPTLNVALGANHSHFAAGRVTMALRQNYALTFVYLSLVTRVNSSVCLIFPDINYTVESHNKNLFVNYKYIIDKIKIIGSYDNVITIDR